MRRINAKFRGKCTNCGKTIRKGESVMWEKGAGVMCLSCHHDTDFQGYEMGYNPNEPMEIPC